ncbi:hypothetical protein ABZP36_030145 [Zizania latifolia]
MMAAAAGGRILSPPAALPRQPLTHASSLSRALTRAVALPRQPLTHASSHGRALTRAAALPRQPLTHVSSPGRAFTRAAALPRQPLTHASSPDRALTRAAALPPARLTLLEDSEKHKVEYEVHRLVVNRDSKFTNFVESTMMKGMIESGARQGLQQNYAQFSDMLSQKIKPIDVENAGTDEEQILASLQGGQEYDWKIAFLYFCNFDAVDV